MVFKFMSKRLVRGVVFLCWGLLLTAAESAKAEEGSALFGESSYAQVRVDLEAGTFLDLLPFDQAFLIVGRVPVSAESVEIRLGEFLEMPVTLSEQELKGFELELRTYLFAAPAQDVQLADSQQLRQTANALLIEQVQSSGGLRPLRQIWHYAMPWNWENWADIFSEKTQAVLAPGTMFDLDEVGRDARELEARLAERVSLAAFIAREARTAQVVTYSPSRTTRLPVQWNRLNEVATRVKGPGAAAAEPAGNWNQLERIRALTGSPDKNFFSASSRGQQGMGEEAGWRTFRVLIQPLEADRYYRFDFHIERKLNEAEMDAFVAGARLRGDDVLDRERVGALAYSDGERLRAALNESLQGAVDRHRLKVGGTVFDEETPYENLHAQMVDLAEDWREAGTDAEAAERLEIKLGDLIRPHSMSRSASIGAATEDNDYVSADIGMLHASRIGETVAYIGANFYLRPVNKSVPLRHRGGLRRVAFTVGLTLNSIEDQRGIRSDLYFNQALVLGAGYRVSQYWRISGGGLVFRERDPESYPLTNKRRTAMTPYVALAFDVDAGRHLKGIGGLFDFLKGGN